MNRVAELLPAHLTVSYFFPCLVNIVNRQNCKTILKANQVLPHESFKKL